MASSLYHRQGAEQAEPFDRWLGYVLFSFEKKPREKIGKIDGGKVKALETTGWQHGQRGDRGAMKKGAELAAPWGAIKGKNAIDQSEFMRERRMPEGLKVTTRLAFSVSSLPVCGLRPRRDFLSLMLNLPNPLNNRSWPVIREVLEIERKVSTDSVDWDLVRDGCALYTCCTRSASFGVRRDT